VAVTADRRHDIAQSIQLSATALPIAQRTLESLNRTLGYADPVIAALRSPAGEVAPTLTQLRPTLVQASSLVQEARPLLDQLRPAVAYLKAAAINGLPLLNGLAPSLRQADHEILPDLAKVYSGSRHTTYEMIGPTLEGLTELAGGFDDQTHLGSLALSVGTNVVSTLPCKSFLFDPKPPALVECESILSYFQQLFGYKPSSGGS
ncbi:MAG: hypothetical protein ACYDHH_33410, partial [Solirubrobacteraceae bacterium]